MKRKDKIKQDWDRVKVLYDMLNDDLKFLETKDFSKDTYDRDPATLTGAKRNIVTLRSLLLQLGKDL